MNKKKTTRNLWASQSGNLWKETRGSVSVFLIAVLAFVLLFAAVLIDYARIAAASVQAERLARAGVRSMMSAYDTSLRDQYGLFAFGSGNGDKLLSRTLSDTLHKSGRTDGFNVVALAYDSSTLEWARTLGSYDVFRHQIDEEMKYKAPLDFALEIAGKFKGLSGAMEEASRTTDLYARLEPLYDRREAVLDQMLDARRQAAEAASPALTLVMNPVAGSIADQTIGSPATAADIAAEYNDYVGKVNSDSSRIANDLAPRYTMAIASYLTQSQSVTANLNRRITDWRTGHAALMSKAGDRLKEAERINEEMREVIRESETSTGGAGYESAGSWDIPGTAAGAASRPNLREQAERLLIDASDFREMESDIIHQQERFESASSAPSALPGQISPSTLGLGSSGAAMKASVLDAAGSLNDYLRGYGNRGTVIGGEAAKIEEHRGSDAERKALEQNAKSKLGDALSVINALRNLNGDAQEVLESYEQLNRYYEESIRYNGSLAESPSGNREESDPYGAESDAMDSVDNLYEGLSSVLLGSRERLFQTEYAAQYFPSFDLSKLQDIASGSAGVAEGELMAQLDPHNQELEYILYGFNQPGLNIAAAYSEIFSVRLAIRTMEGFVNKAGLGNPLLVAAAAILYGVTEAVKDMILLCKDGSVPLAASIPAGLTYRDYLRIFMVIHGSGDNQLSRMLALIRLNTGIDPAERSTAAAAEIRLGLRLWFLPGIMKVLQHTGAVPGEIEGKVYIKTAKAGFAY